jgi:hypothetical protein
MRLEVELALHVFHVVGRDEESEQRDGDDERNVARAVLRDRRLDLALLGAREALLQVSEEMLETSFTCRAIVVERANASAKSGA